MKKDLNKTKEQLSFELNELRNKSIEREEMQKAANQQLQATEQQLRAANQKLEANNQQLEASEQQLRAANKELMASEQRFRKYFEQSLIGMTITSTEKGWIEINDVLCEMLGYTKEELHEMTWVELTHPDDLEADLSQFNRMLANEIDSYMLEKRFIHKDGHIVYTAISVNAYRNMIDQSVEYVLALVHDITVRKIAEERVKEKSKELELILDSSPIMVFYADKDGKNILANNALAKALGKKKEEIEGKFYHELFPKEQAEKMLEDNREVIKSGKPKIGIEEQYESFADTHWSRTSKVPMRDNNGKIIGITGFAEDITERKQAEEETPEK